ncbi:MAG: cytochrome c oxidase subunit 3 [Armatimonadota bacterium]|nr:cytochrome c oxidase subunit 3 [Armatimonadota bacterium]
MTSGVPTLERLRARPEQGPPVAPPAGRDGGGGGGGGGGRPGAAPLSTTITGVWLLVGAAAILFAAFTSTLLVRRAEADWQVGPMPPVLWATTALLLGSSATLEWTRRLARLGRGSAARWGLAATLGLGVVFLAGQWAAWRQMAASGLHMASGAHSAFFYLLTGTHGLHVAGGIAALGWALWKVRWTVPGRAVAAVAPAAVYWHFVDVLWLYVWLVLFWT